METTANLFLPYIMPSQAQKHVTHNEAVRALDSLVMLSVADRTSLTPPAGVGDGARFIVGPSPIGAWSGHRDEVAAWQDGAWVFFSPQEGWLAWCVAEEILLVFSDGAWTSTGAKAGGLQNVAELGVNTSADATNRFAVSSDAALLTHAGGSHRLLVNKNSAADTASIVFQDDFSGRAEIGLAGNDTLSFKVSADGNTFVEAISIDGATGKPTFNAANLLEDYAINLYSDSGRFGGGGASGIGIGAFAWPRYLTLYNGATVAALGKFIHNNDDYGGSAGALDPAVRDLVDMIRDSSYRRYGIEFWVAEVTAGSGQVVSVNYGALTGYYSLYTAQLVRTSAMTFHAYLRALDSAVIVRLGTGQTALVDGAIQTETFAIAPSQNWVSLTIRDVQDLRRSTGYSLSLNLYTQNPGDRYLIACPALMGGLTKIDDNVGIIAGANSWSA